MNAQLSKACVILALSTLVGCAGMSDTKSLSVQSGVLAPGTAQGASESRLQWHAEAQELRAFADHHEVEAEMLLQHPWPADAWLIQQRRALARQLRVAAEQIEQRAEEMP